MTECMANARTDEWYIKSGAELADGWRLSNDGFIGIPWLPITQTRPDLLEQHELDALAAQLVRQVDDLGTTYIHIHGRGTEVDKSGQEPVVRIASGRTMNTIKAIVDSGVLCTGDGNE